MDLEQTVQELRKRINNLRQQLANDSDTSSSSSVKGPAVSDNSSSSEPSLSDAYKAKLMSKRSSNSSSS